MYRVISVNIPLAYKLFSVVKFIFYTQNSIQYEHTLTLKQYCFQGQNEVDPLLSLISPCVLVLSGILSVFPLRMSTLSVCW